MPELPDITIYLDALGSRILRQPIERVRITSPFFLRTTDPPIETVEGKRVLELRRLGKRVVFGLEDGLWLVLHLMLAGRLHWRPPGAKPPGKRGLAAVDFPSGTLVVTEAGSRKRAALHVVRGEGALRSHDPGGLELIEADLATFRRRLVSENHTLKRALTDPRLFSGVGNAYSDEILQRAKLSPVALTRRLTTEEIARLLEAARETLNDWVERLRAETGNGFPEKVTAFRDGMRVHGRAGKPCPECGTRVQRIRYATGEANYCPTCQTGGRLLADRALSRLLKGDWPRTLEELEERVNPDPGTET